MKTITLNLPDEVDEKEIKMSVAALLFDKGTFLVFQRANLLKTWKLWGICFWRNSRGFKKPCKR